MEPPSNLAIGQRIELDVVGRELRLAASVVKIFNRKVWFELAPSDAVLAPGERIRIFVSAPDAVFTMDTEIVATDSRESPGTAIIAIIAAAMKPLQRRGFFRIPVSVPVSLAVIAGAAPELVGGPRVALTTFDLSGGGFRVETELPLAVDDELDIELVLPTGRLALKGRVVRVAASHRPGHSGLLIGVELVGAAGRQQAEIVRFVQSWERAHRLPP